ncbi:S-adenosyl-L-methionine-dependent methyltransferase [Massarina eburnea CBS 473.64]|uniref:S-adenosyl-L-methionine-dependent methyltransferase n=1 Tax=Massarina eburnea CBS 473.64 TaxID=1395130 RepID=A0A6A6RMJ7_9PLEO|nr:S-adenosyl-L-methionine-dependent methyltransferase [Massarina eburnea CBS 473.64]
MSSAQPTTYTQGHDKSVTANHARRTAEQSGSFVLPHLKPTFKILDIGSGPGTITFGFAKYVPQGSVTGIDLSDEVIAQAEELLSQQDPKPKNVTFKKGNVLEGLPFKDGEFDVIYTSQVLIHIHDPVTALKEMKRVCKPVTGIVCSKEGDWPLRYVPYTRGLQLFHYWFYQMIHGKAPEEIRHPDQAPFAPGHRGGSLLHVWAREAGFDPKRIEKGASVQVYATEEQRGFYAEGMVKRIVDGGHGEKFKSLGATEEEVQEIVKGWREWGENVDGWTATVDCEVICHN